MDFGSEENQRILERLNQFKGLEPHPAPGGFDRKLMLTGFGLFKGVESNITSCLIHSLADPNYYHEKQSLNQAPHLGSLKTVPRGEVRSDSGVDRYLRILEIDGKKILLYLLNFDVQWDFSAGVLCHELQDFRPDGLLMMGQGKQEIIFEAGAYNKCSGLNGFLKDGEPYPANAPKKDQLVDNGPTELAMHWPRFEMAKKIKSITERLGLEIQLPESYRPTNTYICNQISYLSLLLCSGNSVEIAGEKFPGLSGKLPESLGFLHLPIKEKVSETELRDWMEIMTNLIHEMV